MSVYKPHVYRLHIYRFVGFKLGGCPAYRSSHLRPTFCPPSAQILPTFLPTHHRDLSQGHIYPHRRLHIISWSISCRYRSCLRGIESWHGGQISRHSEKLLRCRCRFGFHASEDARLSLESFASPELQPSDRTDDFLHSRSLCPNMKKGLVERSENGYVCRQSTSISVLILTFILGIPEIGLLQ